MLKFMVKAGIMHFAEAGGGLTVGLTGQIVGAAMTLGAIASRQRKQQPKKKEKDDRPTRVGTVIVVAEKSPEAKYKLCVSQKWEIFNQEVEKIKQAAEERAFWKSLWITVGSILPGQWPDIPGQGPPPDIPTEGPDAATAIQKEREIEERTKQAADDREKAIKNNCKKPT